MLHVGISHYRIFNLNHHIQVGVDDDCVLSEPMTVSEDGVIELQTSSVASSSGMSICFTHAVMYSYILIYSYIFTCVDMYIYLSDFKNLPTYKSWIVLSIEKCFVCDAFNRQR